MAKKISAAEAQALGVVPLKRRHHIRNMIETLQPGELLHITRHDFTWKKRTPSYFCNQITKATERKFAVMKARNNQGWVVERVE